VVALHKIKPQTNVTMKNCYQEIPLLTQDTMFADKMTKAIVKAPRKVQFNRTVTITLVQSHREYSDTEFQSLWYSDSEYRLFRLDEVHEKLSAPLRQRKKNEEKYHRREALRRLVVRSQDDRNLQRKLRQSNCDYSVWLANICKRESESCSVEARTRGMENDLDLLNFKMREMSSDLSMARSPAMLSTTNIRVSLDNQNTKNARWSPRGKDTLRDVAPNAIKRNTDLRRALCKDFVSQMSPKLASPKSIRRTNTAVGLPYIAISIYEPNINATESPRH